MDLFLENLAKIPTGCSDGLFESRRYIMIHTILANRKNEKLYAEDLAGHDHISFNLYRLKDGQSLLRPCEMPEEKVINFVNAVDLLIDQVSTN